MCAFVSECTYTVPFQWGRFFLQQKPIKPCTYTLVCVCVCAREKCVLESRKCRPPGHQFHHRNGRNEGNNAQKSSSHVHIVSEPSFEMTPNIHICQLHHKFHVYDLTSNKTLFEERVYFLVVLLHAIKFI